MSIPIRLSDELLKQAKRQIKMSLRSVTKQIEFWAQIGKQAEINMTPADIVALVNGEAEIRVLRKTSAPVDFDSVFEEIDSDRKKETLQAKVVTDKIWYEESTESPGLFLRISNDGKSEPGKFVNGKFQPDNLKKP